MKLTYTVEWGEWNKDYECLEVEFEGEPSWENDSFSYAGTHCTGGIGGICKLPDYATMEDSSITWNESLYTENQNSRIKEWLDSDNNLSDLQERFCDHLQSEKSDLWD